MVIKIYGYTGNRCSVSLLKFRRDQQGTNGRYRLGNKYLSRGKFELMHSKNPDGLIIDYYWLCDRLWHKQRFLLKF